MTKIELAKEARKQRRFEKLRTNNPSCSVCGERDHRVLEENHVAGRKRDGFVIIKCRNCHRKVTDDQQDHPAFDPDADTMLDTIGHFLLGLADMLRLIVEKLYEFGLELIERASPAPELGDAK